jgi:hypothetical protein
MAENRAVSGFRSFFQGDTVSKMISVPLAAFTDGQRQLNADYLQTMLAEMMDKDGNLRMLRFKYNAVEGDQLVAKFIEVPLIAAIEPSPIGIEEATIKCTFKIQANDTSSNESGVENTTEIGAGGSVSGSFFGIGFSAYTNFKNTTKVNFSSKNTRSTDTTATFETELKLTRIGMSETMRKLVDAVTSGATGGGGGGN